MKIVFLGTNGFYDSATGNTISTLIDAKEGYIILDAGFGIPKFIKYLKEDKPVYLFLTHFHIDHICGLHTLPKWKLKQPLTIFGQVGLKKMLNTIVVRPFTNSFKKLSYKVNVKELKMGEHNWPFKFECLPLQHVDPAIGYRLYLENKIISYCADTKPCKNGIKLSEGADVVLHECAYDSIPLSDPWGHSDPEAAAGVAKAAKAKKMYLTHFGPNSFDSKAKRLKAQARARKIFKNSFAAFDEDVVIV